MKAIIVSCILLLPVQLLQAQNEPTHSIAELKTFLKKAAADTYRVNLLLEAALVYIIRPGMEKNDYDSALFFVSQATNLSESLNKAEWRARCFRMYSQLYRESGQSERARKYIDNAISIFAEKDLKEDLADSYFELQRYYDVYSDSGWAMRIKYGELAEQLYLQTGDRLKRAATLKDLGDYYQIESRDSMALACLHKALDIYQSVHYPKLEGVYDLIGYVLFIDGDFNQSLKYGLLALETAERVKADSMELCTIFNRVGLSYYRLNRYADAANFFEKSYFIAAAIRDSSAARSVAPNVMDVYFRLGKQKELIAFLLSARPVVYTAGDLTDKIYFISASVRAHVLTGDYKKAESYAKQLVSIISGNTDPISLRNFYRAIIPYYLATGRYKEMYKYLPANQNFCKANNNVIGLADNYLWWFKADSASGDNTSAMAHYKLYKEASDSSLRSIASQQINQLLIDYESVKKDKEIASKENNILQLINEGKLQQQQLKQTKTVENLTFGLVALLLVIMALLYNRYRLKQRTNRKLELQQHEISRQNHSLQHLVNEKEWLLKEVHHRVKNNLQTITGLLGTQSGYLKSEAAIEAVADSQRRIQSMSLIHQKLYQTESLSSINMPDYIHELVDHLHDSFDTDNHIRFDLDIDRIKLGLPNCISLGLILNEAITNCFKYAFPNNRRGLISISLKNTSENNFVLTITDDGIGLPAGFNVARSDSMGMNLMRGLTEELSAQFTISGANGTRIDVAFIYEPDTANEVVQLQTEKI